MTVDEIHEYLLSYVPDKYDTSEGSFFSDILKPVAVQMYFRQNEIELLQENSFALTAAGEYLDRKAAEQGLTRRSGTYSKGTLGFTGVKGEVILSGAKVAAQDILYSVDKSVTIPDTGYVEVSATCTTVGSLGNIKAGEINRFPITLRNITAVINTTDFTGGYDEETDDELRERYLEKVSKPNASGNIYHYISWAKEISGVGNVRVIPLWKGAGTVKVIITNIDNKPADEKLISEVASHIEENRPIGADVTVATPERFEINISVKIIGNITEDTKNDIEKIIDEYLSDIALEKEYVSYAKIGALILSVEGVEDYSDLKINEASDNIIIPDESIVMLGEVSIL